jgi:hypothetical protein
MNTATYSDALTLPEYWGRWFSPLDGSEMKQTNLTIFYQLGGALEDINKVSIGMPMGELLLNLISPQGWLMRFLEETEGIPVPDSRGSAERLLRVVESITVLPLDKNRVLKQNEIIALHRYKKEFDENFARECVYLDVFTVTPKGDRSTHVLLRDASQKFPPNLLAVMPGDTINDLQQAGRCLAFELSTACAFHICRATEALMYAYFLALSAHPWPPASARTWNTLVNQLRAAGAPSVIINRLDEIREDRNSYAHPDVTVPLDEAPIVYELCTGVMFYMAKEIEKLQSTSP